MKKVILVDGNNLLFRSYYATAYNGVIMRNSKGFPTNGLYGFISMMNKIIEEEQPSYIMVAFDKGKTFRHEKYLEYKAGRQETPEELKEQFPVAKEVLDAMGIFHFEIDGYEADDIIGTLAKKVDEEEDFVGTIVSSDKDLLQLISSDIDVKLLKQTGHIRMDEAEFERTYGLKPIRMIDLKSLMGDPSDHIPGVKGIGEKTAISLLKTYGTLDGVYQNLASITGKLREKLETDQENAYMSLDLATIIRDVPLPFTLDDLLYRGVHMEEYIQILQELEFHSLLKKLNTNMTSYLNTASSNTKDQVNDEVVIIDDLAQLHLTEDSAFFLELRGANYRHAELLGMGIYDGKKNYYVPIDVLSSAPELLPLSHLVYTYDVKKAIVTLDTLNLKFDQVQFDMMIACYVLNYEVKDDLAFVAKALNEELPTYEETYGTERRTKEVSLQEIATLTCQKARCIYHQRERILKELKEEEALSLYQDIELPLAYVLADMELTGIDVNRDYLEQMGKDLKVKIDNLEEEIYKSAGERFNINSPKQLGEILFERLAIPYPKRLKNGYSTSKEVLDKVAYVHPIVNQILEYRAMTKLYTSYIIGLISEIKEDGKIHTIYNQTLTRTGRLSSIAPNLQNIPVRVDYGREVRKAFVPSKGACLLSSDYSQIELRMFAHMSGAENLVQAFIEDKDIHSQTASDIFHVPLSEVTSQMRRTAKAVNFGILYGISSFGLSEDLGVNMKTAKEFMDSYLDTYPGIKEYMEKEVQDAHRFGYVKTIMNRKRTIEELKSSNYLVRSQGERMALNTPIQGSSADILKKAMIDIYNEFTKKKLKSKMLLQVHDELVFDVFNDELEEVREIVKRIMEHVVELRVPLKVEIATGSNWYEAK